MAKIKQTYIDGVARLTQVNFLRRRGEGGVSAIDAAAVADLSLEQSFGETPMTRESLIAGLARAPRLWPAAALPAMLLGGCAKNGAPSLIFAGSYFPAWMACALFGVLAALALRLALGRIRFGSRVAFPLVFYVAIMLLASIAFWLIGFAGAA